MTSKTAGTFNAGWIGVGVLLSGAVVLLLLSVRGPLEKTAGSEMT